MVTYFSGSVICVLPRIECILKLNSPCPSMLAGTGRILLLDTCHDAEEVFIFGLVVLFCPIYAADR